MIRNKVKNTPWRAALAVSVAFVVVGVTTALVRQNNLNRDLLEVIQSGGTASAAQRLIHEGADANATGTSVYDSALFRAVVKGNPEMVQVLLASGASVQPVGVAKTGPLLAFTSSDTVPPTECRAIIKELQGRGESIEERDVLGFTPLMRAVWSGNTVATKALLDLGANSHVVNNSGQTVWDWTDRIPTEQGELVKLLREHQAGPGPSSRSPNCLL